MTDPGQNTATDDIVVTVTARPRLVVSPTKLSVTEGTTGDTYRVRLATAPGGPVTVTPKSNDTEAATVSPATLSFTKDNWGTDQTVTVTGVEDDDGADESVTVTHTVSGYGSVTSGPSVAVTVTDPDTVAPDIVLNPTSLSITEGEKETYTVKLDLKPSATVTVQPTSGDTTRATVAPASLTFTASDWDQEQTVTVTTKTDADETSDTVEISHSVTGSSRTRKVTVTVLETSAAQNPNPVADPTGWAPTIRSVAADDRALTPSWTNQQDAGAIQSHEIEYVRADYSEPAVVATNGPETWYRVANLENGVEYEMRVRTTTASQYVSEWSEPARGTPFKPDYRPRC